MMWGSGYGYGHMGGYGFLGDIFSLVWFIVVIMVVVGVVRYIAGGRRMHRFMGEKDALEILRERYAKGEIDKAEFEEKKKDLS